MIKKRNHPGIRLLRHMTYFEVACTHPFGNQDKPVVLDEELKILWIMARQIHSSFVAEYTND